MIHRVYLDVKLRVQRALLAINEIQNDMIYGAEEKHIHRNCCIWSPLKISMQFITMWFTFIVITHPDQWNSSEYVIEIYYTWL